MNAYKNYIAHTQAERIALDTLATLDEIRELLKENITKTVKSAEVVKPKPARKVKK